MSMKHLFGYRGRFQWWSYTVSHGQLLLRSTKSSLRPTQVDILFKDVSMVALSTSIEDVEVLEELVEEEQSRENRKRFLVRGVGVDGYVVAGAVFHAEGDYSHWDSSPLVVKFPP
jgi:hypothetical protein